MNYKEMQSINTALVKPLQKTMNEVKSISESISESMIFHKTKFRSHLQCKGHHICQCLSCGFTHPDQDKTNGHHSDFIKNKDFNVDGKKTKKPATRRAKKDPNAPKRPLNTYMLYGNSVTEQIRDELPNLSMGEVVRN